MIDLINLIFLKKKIDFQKKIKIKNYIINFNTRKLLKNNKVLSLTEKEAMIISFLKNADNAVSINELQKNVWGYKSNSKHTHRNSCIQAQKKSQSIDNNFIQSLKSGYKL